MRALDEHAKRIAAYLKTGKADDLRKPRWQGLPDPLAGHCYIASELLYYFAGYEWKPMFVRVNGEPHWFIQHRKTGKILDVTAEQFAPGSVPYKDAKGKGFLTRWMSNRTTDLHGRYMLWDPSGT